MGRSSPVCCPFFHLPPSQSVGILCLNSCFNLPLCLYIQKYSSTTDQGCFWRNKGIHDAAGTAALTCCAGLATASHLLTFQSRRPSMYINLTTLHWKFPPTPFFFKRKGQRANERQQYGIGSV
ncbi:hypothetical protein BDW75DRAFT_210785 [Aspergillus navahoensis]